MNEVTLSSISRLCFGDYKVQILDLTLLVIRCSLINLAIKNRTLLIHWTKRLSVMPKKLPGKIYVSKIRVILLLEADFNTLHKIIFNKRILSMLE